MHLIRIILLTYLLCLVTASQAVPQQAASDKQAKTKRLISLAPSNTELIYSLKSGKQLIAVSESCDYPIEAKKKEKVGNFSSVKMEKIAKLKPDLIALVSGQEKLDSDLKKHHFSTVLLDNSSIKNIGKNLRVLGNICQQEAEAKRLSTAFENAIEELKSITDADKSKAKVFICVWPQPLMSAGKSSFMNEGITIAGGTNCTGDLPQPYPRINQERLLLMQPDMILIPHELGGDKFWTKSPWTSLRAVKEKHVYVLPQHETDCLARPTLR
ncbi:MAG: helical backbone metal receptor, partial [Candidatus Obscuribacterales bacterium]|nr:helical backbone metal receptor [Candidatus Obscuribacterales bacterium]